LEAWFRALRYFEQARSAAGDAYWRKLSKQTNSIEPKCSAGFHDRDLDRHIGVGCCGCETRRRQFLPVEGCGGGSDFCYQFIMYLLLQKFTSHSFKESTCLDQSSNGQARLYSAVCPFSQSRM
jgi:hypothetical protein